MLYNSNIINFNLIIYDVINEKRYIFIIKKNNVITLAYRNNKEK